MNKAEKTNTYLDSRALWDDIYGTVQTKLQNAQRLLWIAMVTIAILAIAMIVITVRNPIKPYVTVLKNNEAITLFELESEEFKTLKPKLAIALATEFLQSSRTLSSDDTVNQNRQIKAMSLTAESATKILLEHLKTQHDSNTTVAIQIQTVLVKSAQTLVFRWQEIGRDKQTGEVLDEANYSAEVNFEFVEKYQTELQQKMNPIGFYITHLAWTKDL